MSTSDELIQTPSPARHLLRFCGDVETFDLKLPKTMDGKAMDGKAWIRTNIGRANIIRKEIIDQIHQGSQPLSRSWFDIPMGKVAHRHYRVTLPLCDVGHFEAKCFFVQKGQSTPLWPPGTNTLINVEPADTCAANIIYNAFVRQFGPNKDGRLEQTDREDLIKPLDEAGYTVIPPSGTFRDLIAELDFIIGRLGCRIIQLLPVHATPTTYARMGRFGSPYAALNFMSVDPGLAVFDPTATPTEQFIELIDAVHTREGKLIMDIAINHTGWAARLHDAHPEWLVRGPDGHIEMPGAWGVTWADLTRLDYSQKELWRYMARIFRRWCRRGVDGFRCDAGYMIPEPAWQYIVACVRDEYPDTVFFLEGLGGPIAVTRNLLNRANINWAYSELFQNDDRDQIEHYLPEAIDISHSDGGMVHFAETHDNNRLASRSKTWARMRTAVCALASRHGAFAFANGVEWYADAKIDVHQAPSLNWGSDDNQVAHIYRLNQILKTHPTFADRVDLTIVSDGPGNFLALDRFHRVSKRHLLVLANLGDKEPVRGGWHGRKADFKGPKVWDLITGQTVTINHGNGHDNGRSTIELTAGQVLCLSDEPDDLERIDLLSGQTLNAHVQRVEDQRLYARALEAYRYVHGTADLGNLDVKALAATLKKDPREFCLKLRPNEATPGIIDWTWPTDTRREVVVLPGHFLYIWAPHPFRARITAGKKTLAQEVSLIQDDNAHFVLFTPLSTPVKSEPGKSEPGKSELEKLPCRLTLALTVYEAAQTRHEEGLLHFPTFVEPERLNCQYSRREIAALEKGMFLDTNGRGGMLHVPVRWGELYSRYDALLSANLNPDYPEDRWVMFTRCRGWVVYQGYSTEINSDCLDRFDYEIGVGGRWQFTIPTGQGEHIRLTIVAAMVPDKNAMALVAYRSPGSISGSKKADHLADSNPVRLILRPDIEDRSFHDTTKAFTGPEQAFPSALTPGEQKFEFTPATQRCLEMTVLRGTFVLEPEWHYMVHRSLEAERGLDPDSDLFSPGYFATLLAGGEHELLTAGISEPEAVPADFSSALVQWASQPDTSIRREASLTTALTAALDQFVVKRGSNFSVVAGYPWFLDWGRDTLIAVRGLVAAGRYEVARKILIQFGRFEQDGTLPNMIHGDRADNRDTSDAPLWFFTACADLMKAEKNRALMQIDCGGRSIEEILLSIGNAMIAGTPNGVKMDAESGLIFSPSHFTWMDTNHPAGTPRQGYPVEIQALWHAALQLLAKVDPDGGPWADLQTQVKASLKRYFYLKNAGYMADCLHADPGVSAEKADRDDALRPNQLFAITLGAIDDPKISRAMVTACQALVVPGAIRSIADRPVAHPIAVIHQGQVLNDPHHPYQGRYEGDEDTQRKPAYHNGTAWTWVFPTFCEAWVTAWGSGARKSAQYWLSSSSALIRNGCVGHLPEIVDGDFPHQSRGCDAQAWGVSEYLRVWRALGTRSGK